MRTSTATNEAKRLDEIRRDWMGQAQRAQAEFVRLTLLLVGGAMIALMTLTGVVLQARLPVELETVRAPMGWFAGALLFLLIHVGIQAAAVGAIAVFALDPDSSLTRRATWHASIYWIGFLLSAFVLLQVVGGVVSAFHTMPALFDALQTSLIQNPPKP
ncbi:hypothetical protein [Brevundimonas aurantiaca]|uniref:hypothetical protein n=1 Tax=Brevundimonas aurantiaca TaxID=74316 RepID=UPI002FDE40A2